MRCSLSIEASARFSVLRETVGESLSEEASRSVNQRCSQGRHAAQMYATVLSVIFTVPVPLTRLLRRCAQSTFQNSLF